MKKRALEELSKGGERAYTVRYFLRASIIFLFSSLKSKSLYL